MFIFRAGGIDTFTGTNEKDDSGTAWKRTTNIALDTRAETRANTAFVLRDKEASCIGKRERERERYYFVKIELENNQGCERSLSHTVPCSDSLNGMVLRRG